jgi:dCTP deaminase
MALWSGEKLAAELPALIDPYDPTRIDCAAYTLALGPEVFVTTDLRLEDSPDQGLKLTLKPNAQCRIPPGQFAFLLTEERVEVPANALAFISMRARYKFKGLVNVSGFHVDPGWNGRLVFSVYNAGPSPAVLSRGAGIFLIWYADLDRTSERKKQIANPQESIDDQLVEGMSGQVFSPIALNKDVAELKEKAIEGRDEFAEKHFNLRVELVELRSEHNFYKKVLWFALAIVAAVVVREGYLIFFKEPVEKAHTQTIIRERVVDVPQAPGFGSQQKPQPAQVEPSAPKPKAK